MAKDKVTLSEKIVPDWLDQKLPSKIGTNEEILQFLKFMLNPLTKKAQQILEMYNQPDAPKN